MAPRDGGSQHAVRDALVLKLAEQGKTTGEIAAAVGIGESRVLQIKRTAKLRAEQAQTIA